MPKSKRAKVVSLTQTKKKDREWKSSLIDRVRDALESRSACYVFKYENMRNGTFKEMRAATEETTIFFVGSNKVLRVALGPLALCAGDEEDEVAHLEVLLLEVPVLAPATLVVVVVPLFRVIFVQLYE